MTEAVRSVLNIIIDRRLPSHLTLDPNCCHTVGRLDEQTHVLFFKQT